MRKKIIGVLVFFMLTMPIISAVGMFNTNETKEEVNTQYIEEDLTIVIYKAPVSFGVNLDITNEGTTTLTDVEWSFRTKAAITGTGIFISEKLRMGTIDEIMPGETKTLKFRPLNQKTKSPIGLGNLYMNASAEVNGMSVRTQQRAFILGFIILMYKDTYMDIKPAEAYERYMNNEFDLIIDVVGLDLYSLGHLPGAVNYVWADGTLRNKIPDLDPSWTYLVYCHTDPPSTASAQLLVDAGFEHIYRLEGNIGAWRDAGYPIET